VTRLWPVSLENFETKEAMDGPDKCLVENIKLFWKWVFQNIPRDIPYYPAPIPPNITKLFEKVEKEKERATVE
jgi:hypothetical protein